MTLLWLEGCEASTDDGVLARMYASKTGASFQAIPGALNREHSAWSGFDQVLSSGALRGTTTNTLVVGFMFRPDNDVSVEAAGGGGVHVALHNTDGEQLRLEMFDDSPASSKAGGAYYKLRVMRGVTELASTDQRFWIANNDDAWVHFEWKVTIDNATGSFELRYWDPRRHAGTGIQTATWDAATTSLDTQDQTSTGADRFEISWNTANGSQAVAFDDIHILDTAGSKNNDFIGPVAIEGQDVSGDGNTVDWTLAGGAISTEDAWNEGFATSEDDKRLTSDVTSEVHLATITPLSSIKENVVGVRCDHYSRMESTPGSLTLHFRYRKTTAAPAETDGGSYVLSATSISGHADVQEDDPNTATTWVAADLDAAEIGTRNGG